MSVNILVLPVPAQVFVRDREPISVSAVHGGGWVWKTEETGEPSVRKRLVDLGPTPAVTGAQPSLFLKQHLMTKLYVHQASPPPRRPPVISLQILYLFHFYNTLGVSCRQHQLSVLRTSATVLLLISANPSLADRAATVTALPLSIRHCYSWLQAICLRINHNKTVQPQLSACEISYSGFTSKAVSFFRPKAPRNSSSLAQRPP